MSGRFCGYSEVLNIDFCCILFAQNSGKSDLKMSWLYFILSRNVEPYILYVMFQWRQSSALIEIVFGHQSEKDFARKN